MRKFRWAIAPAALLALGNCTGTPQHYLVFFPRDTSVLTPEAQIVVAEIARRSAADNGSRIVVEGQAEGVTGPETALAQARAAHVAEALSAGGIEPARIERRATVSQDGQGGVAARKVVVTLEP
jgi:hypothetical protein